jgi:hypothetical protein
LELTKHLLIKPTQSRTAGDIDSLAALIKENKFFKEREELTTQDIKDLAASFQFHEEVQFDDVVTYGEVGDLFYLIIMGSVSVQVPNPEIKKWDWSRKDFQRLKIWKDTEFDEKMKIAQKEAEVHYN